MHKSQAFSKEKILEFLKNKKTLKEISRYYECDGRTIKRFLKKNKINHSFKDTISEETKTKISKSRKRFLKENPDKHPWRYHNKFKSRPCELLKQWLKSKKIFFIEELIPNVPNRNFSIDIAFPHLKIGIEVNGNQHYNKDGTLKPYYAQRQKEIQKLGWIIHQIHYSFCFKLNKIEKDILNIIGSPTQILTENFSLEGRDDIRFHHRAKTKHKKPLKIKKQANQAWRKQPRPHKRKVIRPLKEELELLLINFPITSIGKKYGVTDNTIRKWAKCYGIQIPKNGRGFWSKKTT